MCMLNLLPIKPKKIFECFISFWKCFWYFCVFSFCSKCNFCFSSKTGSEVFSRVAHDLELPAKFALGKLKSHIFIQKLSLLPREYFMTKLFSRNVFRQNCNFLKFIQRLSRLYRYCFATKSFSQKLQYVSRLISLLSNSRKIRVFSFYVADVTSFQNS